MKTLNLICLLFSFMSVDAKAFVESGSFKIEMVKPLGEFGFRALGSGKTNNVVLPTGQLGSDKKKCQEDLAKYFASAYNKRVLASVKSKQRTENKKTLSFR